MNDWADIPKQTFFGLEETDGKIPPGDCWRCCIAAVIGMPASDVPHFVMDERSDPDAATQKWLNERGYVLIRMSGRAPFFPSNWRRTSETSSVACHLELPVIACGTTHRTKLRGQHHAVVMHRGKLVYDPHPDNSGLTYEVEHYIVAKAWEGKA